MRAKCAGCGSFLCSQGAHPGTKDLPESCPMRERREALREAKKAYSGASVQELFLQSSRLEGEYQRAPRTRLEETLVFAKRMGYHKLGLAFCIGLKREASTIARIMARRGFEVVGACCKVGGMPKEEMGLREEEKLHPFHFEACCNPIAQAKILNGEGTDLNVLVGLCVGHDTLFMRFSLAPVTCLIAKDRVLGHNPAAAVYTSESYYRERLWSDED